MVQKLDQTCLTVSDEDGLFQACPNYDCKVAGLVFEDTSGNGVVCNSFGVAVADD